MKTIDKDLVAALHAKAAAASRLRTHHNLHPTHEDPIQRMCMAMEPGTYVRPHRHPEKWELLLIVSGDMRVLHFDAQGQVLSATRLATGGETLGLETPVDTWHGVVTLAPATVVFECKLGPYVPTVEKDFAAWAPAEGHARCAEFERWFRAAQVGDLPPAFKA
ncbi:MAG TPA: WbuC family cupin fold metalloprotein [Gammaproteobacteria bacterium]|nr:WbuC family cupin fold metalloprotein [Gammaproteobacteria bacterium]